METDFLTDWLLLVFAALCVYAPIALAALGLALALNTAGRYYVDLTLPVALPSIFKSGPAPDASTPVKRPVSRYTYDADGLLTKIERGTAAAATEPERVVAGPPARRRGRQGPRRRPRRRRHPSISG